MPQHMRLSCLGVKSRWEVGKVRCLPSGSWGEDPVRKQTEALGSVPVSLSAGCNYCCVLGVGLTVR